VNDKIYIVILKDVLYISTNSQSLIVLGRWDKYGGHIKIDDRHLSLLTKHGKLITMGKRLKSNLYKMDVQVRKPEQVQSVQNKAHTVTQTIVPIF